MHSVYSVKNLCHKGGSHSEVATYYENYYYYSMPIIIIFKTYLGTQTVISGMNIPLSVNSGVYRARMTSKDPCLISFI